ncbi:unnamed protein product [Camellia sinensis]
MDLTITSITTNTHTPDSENETPSAPTAPPNNKTISFTNGALKKHSHHKRRRSPPPVVVVKYKECLKNHAASLGGHALDGCGEFMPSPATATATATTTDNNPTDPPNSLKCAACGCHRNFHRREDDNPTTTTTHFLDFYRPHHHPLLPLSPTPCRSSPPSSTTSPPPPPPLPQPSYYSSAPHMLLALSSAAPEDQFMVTPATPTAAKAENPNGRKRFRTKFSQQQKEKMFSFSDKLGWKMQKCDESLVEEFCNEVGVGKGVLKVWMHNNKHSFAKRDFNSTTINNNNNNHHHHNEGNNGVHLHVSTNGSSSSA